MDTDKRIEGAKLIVEFMPDWEKSLQTQKFYHEKLGHDRPYGDLWTDRNLQADVLDEFEHGKEWDEFVHQLIERTCEDYPVQASLIQLSESDFEKMYKAKPETIFDAIVATLEGDVE